MFKSPRPRTSRIAFIVFLLALTFAADVRAQVNQPPIAAGESYTLHGGGLVGPVLANDYDPDGNPMNTTIVTYPTKGTLYGLYAGIWSYQLSNISYVGADSFTYKACDPSGACSSPVTVNITIVNSDPVAVTDNYTVHGGTDIGPFKSNDYDPDGDTLTDSFLTGPAHGTLYGTATPGVKRYAPVSGYVGSDSFTYKVCDPYNKCATGTVNINVVNNAPIAMPDFYTVRGSTIVGPWMQNDFDPDGDTINSTPTIVTYPQHGSLYGLSNPGPNDMKNYVPQANFAGLDTFTYKINDNLGLYSVPAPVFLFVTKKDGAENAGWPGCLGVGEPVNVSNGNVYLQQTDYQLPGAGEAIDVTRAYNSILQTVGLFGKSWSTAYDESIEAYDNNLLRLNLPDGRAVYFGNTSGSGAFAPLTPDFRGQVSKNADGTFTLTLKDGRAHVFSAAGKLLTLTDRNGNQTTLAYNAGGKLASVTDAFGRVLTVTTNTSGRVLSLADSMGTVATYTYGTSQELLSVTYADNSKYQFAYGYANSNQVLTSVTDALGNVLEAHAYDSQGRAITSEKQGGVERYTLSYVSATQTDVTDALGHVTKYFFSTSKGRNVLTRTEGACACGGPTSSQTWTYDSQLNVLTRTSGLNQTTSYTYDADGNTLTVTNALGTITFTYNQFGQILTATDSVGRIATYSYDATGNLLLAKDALNNETTFAYNQRGLVQTVTDARQKVTSFAYDSNGNLTQETDAANNVTTMTYDARGRLVSGTDALNHTSSVEYDAAGRIKKVFAPDNTFSTYTYDLAGRRTAVTDARSNTTSYGYDGAYRLTSITNAANKVTAFGYDSMSNLTSLTDPLNRVTNYEYDYFNRLTKVIYPPAETGAARLTKSVVYDAGGRVTSRTDEAERVTGYEYDGSNRLVKVTDPASKATRYEYNVRSQVTAVVDALNQRYEFDLDALGRVTEVTRGGLSMSYAYDAVSNPTQRVDFNGAATTYTYDDLNRLTAVGYPDTTTVSYAYDPVSRLSSATNVTGTVGFSYDNLGRVSTATDVFNQTVGYGYDANGNRTSLSLNGSAAVSYQYDALNRLTQLTDSGGAATSFSYDAGNKLSSRTLPNGVTASYQYDGLDRLKRLQQVKGANTLADYQYQHNAASEITQLTDPAGAHTYAYDLIDRLISATHPSAAAESYVYDATGNRTASHLSPTYGYQPFNKVVSAGSTTYSYDNNGNLISKADGTGTWQYGWDYENRLKQVTRPDGQTISYEYDALGRRVRRTKGGVWTEHVYDGQDVIKDINADGSTIEYLNGPGIDNKLRQTSASGTFYFLQDHLGSTRALTDVSGSVVESTDYDSFGNGASSLTRYGYTGREWDADANLYYYRNRWYDPHQGRFISEDPIGLGGGINMYSYVSNNPVSKTDPLGLYEKDVHFYLTYYLARKTGCFKEWASHDIAEEDQATDTNSDTSPAPGFSAKQRRQNREFHALHRGAAEGVGSPTLWQYAMNEPGEGTKWIGRYLHYEQDTFSHAGYYDDIWGHSPPNLVIGNFVYGDHNVDKTAADPAKAQRMVAATWVTLKKFAKAKKCSCNPRWDGSWWGEINEFINVESTWPRSSSIDTKWEDRSLSDWGLADPARLEQKRKILNVPPQ